MGYFKRRAFTKRLTGMPDFIQVLGITTFEPCLAKYRDVMQDIDPSEWDYCVQVAAFWVGSLLAESQAETLGVSDDHVSTTLDRSLSKWFSQVQATLTGEGDTARDRVARAMYAGELYAAGQSGFQEALDNLSEEFSELPEGGGVNAIAAFIGSQIVSQSYQGTLDSGELRLAIGGTVVQGMLDYFEVTPRR